jgi:hypothetical protein
MVRTRLSSGVIGLKQHPLWNQDHGVNGIVILGLLVLCVGCDGYTSASGTVVDGDGQPIEGATVTMSLQDSQIGIGATTNKDGNFEESGCHAPGRDPIDLRVKKDGYEDHYRELFPNRLHANLRIVLERETTVSTSGDATQ